MNRIVLVFSSFVIVTLVAIFGVQAHAASLDANCIGKISVPEVVHVGDRFQVTVQVKNNGSNAWVAANQFFLGSQNPQDNQTWGLGRVPLPVSRVEKKQTVTFSFFATAPSTIGKYPFVWQMLQEHVTWFGQKCKTKNDIAVWPRFSTPTPIPTPTVVPTPTITPVITPTPLPTIEPTVTPIPTPTVTPDITPTPTPTQLPTVTPDQYGPTPNPYNATPTPAPFSASVTSPIASSSFPSGQGIVVAASGSGTPVCGTWELVDSAGQHHILSAIDFEAGQLPGGLPSCQTGPYAPY